MRSIGPAVTREQCPAFLRNSNGRLDCKSVSSPKVHEVYPKYAASLAGIEKDEKSGLKPEFLAAKMSKIVTKKNPRYHYIISTFLQKLSVIIKPILPPSVFAKIISLYYGL